MCGRAAILEAACAPSFGQGMLKDRPMIEVLS